MADFPLPDHGNQTPLALAKTPSLDALAAAGVCGRFTPIPEGLAAGSDIGNLSLFGYDPSAAFTGRAPLEAARHGVRLERGEVAFRCNLVHIEQGRMASFTAGHISTGEASGLIEALSGHFSRNGVRFLTGVGYRHLLIARADDADALAEVVCTPPHDISDQPVAPHFPRGAAAGKVVEVMEAAKPVLRGHPVNEERLRQGLPPASDIWLWGQGSAPQLASYAELFGLTGAVVSAVDLVNGIGVCAGFDVVEVPGATGYLDTDYEGKVRGALEALADHDVAYLHVEAPDETSHEGRLDLKLRAIEDFDRRVVGPCWEAAQKAGDVRVFAGPDHITALSTRTHAGGPAPFAVAGAGVEPNGVKAYNEAAVSAEGVIDPGFRLMRAFLREPTLRMHELLAD
jgi:2,3-bisphosphoglycerate-independent phosphoglycerate mutase